MKTKALISFTVTAKLICAFVFAYADCLFSHVVAHFLGSASIMGSKRDTANRHNPQEVEFEHRASLFRILHTTTRRLPSQRDRQTRQTDRLTVQRAGGRAGRQTDRQYLKPLFSCHHRIVSTALFRGDHGSHLLLSLKSEVRLQHPPVRIHTYTI